MDADLVYLANFLFPSAKEKIIILIFPIERFSTKRKSFLHSHMHRFYSHPAYLTTIGDKSYGKNCYLDNFVFLSLSPS